MNIMVVGGGGREHAIIKKLKKSNNVDKIYALPGNGGIALDAECVDIGAKDIDAIVDFAKNNKIDFAVVAPDDPLVLGAVDALEAVGIPAFGPKKNAAIIEEIRYSHSGIRSIRGYGCSSLLPCNSSHSHSYQGGRSCTRQGRCYCNDKR